MTGENGAKISSISHSNGPILVGQSRESQAKWVRVGKPGEASKVKLTHVTITVPENKDFGFSPSHMVLVPVL